jgi:hypothetical protein
VVVFCCFFLLDKNVTLTLCDNLLFQSINRINSACKISFDHRAGDPPVSPQMLRIEQFVTDIIDRKSIILNFHSPRNFALYFDVRTIKSRKLTFET